MRGEFKTPKSRRGSRGVPLADRAARGELDEPLPRPRSAPTTTSSSRTRRPGSRSTARGYRKRFKRACGRAGVRVVRFHDLRHTFGTRVAASGEVSLRTLQEWMGHRDAKTTLIYADYQPAEHESEIVGRAFR